MLASLGLMDNVGSNWRLGMSMRAQVFDDEKCFLGEGPLWHPRTETLYWFDILAGRLMARGPNVRQAWEFGEPASAAGWIDANRLLVATASGLWDFDTKDGAKALLAEFPKSFVPTRSNDGRADHQGGFWIGTMGLNAEAGAGAIYRFFGGELRCLYDGLAIPNSIAFAVDGRTAYFADTLTHVIKSQALDAQGWPQGDPRIHVDLRSEGLNPDGSVVDAQGRLWNAQWGAHRVARYLPDGSFERAVEIPASNASCPAFGGEGMKTLYVTTACEGLSEAELKDQPQAGCVFSLATGFEGVAEPKVDI